MPDQYYELTVNELDGLLEHVEVRDIRQWRHTRSLETLLYNINVEKKDRKTPSEYMPLPGDDDLRKAEPELIPPNVMLHLLANTFNLPLKEN